MHPDDEFIVKVQWPLATNYDEPQCLVYNEDRSIRFEMPAEEWKDILGIHNPKGFFGAKLVDGKCQIDGGAQLEDQGW